MAEWLVRPGGGGAILLTSAVEVAPPAFVVGGLVSFTN
jgi:hypothetical protein